MFQTIEVATNFPHNPSVSILAEHLPLPIFGGSAYLSEIVATGILVSLWTWAASFAPNGDLSGFPDKIIAKACQWEGDPAALISALRDSGWIDDDQILGFLGEGGRPFLG